LKQEKGKETFSSREGVPLFAYGGRREDSSFGAAMVMLRKREEGLFTMPEKDFLICTKGEEGRSPLIVGGGGLVGYHAETRLGDGHDSSRSLSIAGRRRKAHSLFLGGEIVYLLHSHMKRKRKEDQ